MASARIDFIDRIRTLKITISETEAVRSKGPKERTHNEIARMLRNGLAVVGFATLEDFVKARSSEILESIGTTGVLFDQLPEKVQIATTYGAISALNYQIGLRDKQEKIDYAQDHTLKISSTGNSAYTLTALAFGYGQSNLNVETIKKILGSFGVEDPWGQITHIASSLGLAALPLDESFKNAAIRRHKAAHVANADTPQGDINQFVNEAIAIAIGFDFLFSKALSLIKDLDPKYLNGSTKIAASDIGYRVVKLSDQKWKEYSSKSARAYRASIDIDSVIVAAKRRAMLAKQFYVQFDESGLVKDWVC
jgi:hypothetical protein